MSFIVNRPKDEPGFGLVRAGRRRPHDALHASRSYATDKPEGERY